MLWTLVATAVLMTTLQALTAGPRRRIQAMVAWPTLAAAVSLLVNGLVCWAAVALASAAGLAVSVAGYLPALCASLVIPIVAGATVTAVRGLVAQARPS
jgi:hypothetical protein